MDRPAELIALTRRQFLVATGVAGIATLHGIHPLRASAAVSYEASVLAKNPVGYWRLGDDPGPALDRSGHGHEGAFVGQASVTRPGALTGDPDGAVLLNGRGSYIEIPSHPDFSQSTSGQGLSVEAWVRPDVLEFKGDSKDQYIHWLGKGGAAPVAGRATRVVQQYEWAFRFYSRTAKRPNRMSAYLFNLEGGLGAGAYFEDKLTAGEWIHVVACYDAGGADSPGRPGVSIYKNGELRQGPSSSGARYNNRLWQITSVPGLAPVRLGTRDLGRFLTGALDEVAIYPRVLSAAEVLDNYRIGKGFA